MNVMQEDHNRKIARDGTDKAHELAGNMVDIHMKDNPRSNKADVQRMLEKRGFTNPTDRRIVQDVLKKKGVR